MLDMAEEWRKLDAVRHAPGSVDEWDERAGSYGVRRAHSGYAEAFLERVSLGDGESVLDMGCGPGTLALPLARLGHAVVAADFSEGMLCQLESQAGLQGIEVSRGRFPSPGTVKPLLMSWEDDWAAFGVGERSVDVAIASRSIITHDLADSLYKLSVSARRRVCVSVGTGISPRVDPAVARAMGLTLERHNDALFVFGIASELGFEPCVSYIHSSRCRVYPNREEAYHSLLKTMDYVKDASEQVDVDVAARRLDAWLDMHLVPCDNGVRLDEAHDVPWAFISWDV